MMFIGGGSFTYCFVLDSFSIEANLVAASVTAIIPHTRSGDAVRLLLPVAVLCVSMLASCRSERVYSRLL